MRARSIGAAAATALALVAARDLVQKKHALLRNFPVSGTPGTCWRGSGRSCGSTS